MLKSSKGEFIHVVASVNRAEGNGKILYVNPSTISTSAEAARGTSDFDDFTLVMQDGNGNELARLKPNVQVAGCEGSQLPVTGLVNEDIPRVAGMQRVVLYHADKEVSRYEAGAASGGGVASGMGPMSVTVPISQKNNRIALGVPQQAAITAEPGVTYTVQVKAADRPEWHTVAVGRATPDVEIDRNQFPGLAAVTVRVLRSTGFEDKVLSQQDIALDY